MDARAIIAAIVSCGLCAAAASAADYVVVVNRDNHSTELSKSTLKRVFTGKQTNLGTLRLVPINLPLDSDLAKAFLAEIVGMTPEEYKAYWIEQQVKGQSSAPMIQRTDEGAAAVTSEIPGAIAYVKKGTDVSNVKPVVVVD